jgi:hypothetical protein
MTDSSLLEFLRSAVTEMHACAMDPDAETAHDRADDVLVDVVNRLARELPADFVKERELVDAILMANNFAKRPA